MESQRIREETGERVSYHAKSDAVPREKVVVTT